MYIAFSRQLQIRRQPVREKGTTPAEQAHRQATGNHGSDQQQRVERWGAEAERASSDNTGLHVSWSGHASEWTQPVREKKQVGFVNMSAECSSGNKRSLRPHWLARGN
eukprot:1152030-Pelagomonas_calceolata.AAC.11